MIDQNKIHSDACATVMQAIDNCCDTFKSFGVNNIEWQLLAIREIDVDGLSERWLKIVCGETAWT